MAKKINNIIDKAKNGLKRTFLKKKPQNAENYNLEIDEIARKALSNENGTAKTHIHRNMSTVHKELPNSVKQTGTDYNALYEERIKRTSAMFDKDNIKMRNYMTDKSNRNFNNFKERIKGAKTQEDRIEIARSIIGDKIDANATENQLMIAAAKHYSSKSAMTPQFHDKWNANHMTQKTVGSGLVLSSMFALTGDKGHLSNPQLYGQE